MRKLTDEQKLSFGRFENAEFAQSRPKCHQDLMRLWEGARIRKDSIGATNDEVAQMRKAARDADRAFIEAHCRGGVK